MEIEKELLEIYEHMRDVTEWYNKELEKAIVARDDAYSKKQNARKWINAARGALRDKLNDLP